VRAVGREKIAPHHSAARRREWMLSKPLCRNAKIAFNLFIYSGLE
jgi:hypothetical protein